MTYGSLLPLPDFFKSLTLSACAATASADTAGELPPEADNWLVPDYADHWLAPLASILNFRCVYLASILKNVLN